jgi:hypothetical protein
MKWYRTIFYFLLLIPITILTYEVRETLIEMRRGQEDLFLLNSQRASQQRLIMGLEVRILHHVEGHEDKHTAMCPACFKNLLVEKYDHPLIRKFLKENGQNPDEYYDGVLEESEIK